jgi:hypothetical protein
VWAQSFDPFQPRRLGGRTSSGELLAGVLVPHERRPGCDLDAVLDDLASRNAEIVLLQIGAQEAEGLRTVSLM